jgi:dipeptidyl aminopeptidase/acylaminoacyl peptidase
MFLVLCAVGAGALFACYIAARSYLNERKDYMRTPSPVLARQPALAKITGLQEISFSAPSANAPGAASVAAWYAPPTTTRAAVILVHGVDAERTSLLFETRILAQAGFGVLALDLPGQGASGGKTEWGIPERRAISAAVDWLSQRREVDPQRIGAFGLSMGAYVLAQTAVLDTRIAAVILAATPNDVVEFNWLATRGWGWLSQYPTYWALRAAGTPIDFVPKDILGRLAPRPVLIVQGELDPLVPPWMAQQLFAAARQPKELYLIAGAHHADYSLIDPVNYRARLCNFFARTLQSPGLRDEPAL